MSDHSKKTSFTMLITVLLSIMLTGCDFLNPGKPEAVVEIDLTKAGKVLPADIYSVFTDSNNQKTIAKENTGTGNLKSALVLATSFISLENSVDSISKVVNSVDLELLGKRNKDLGMIVDNGIKSYKTPSYYVLKTFSENKPDKVMPTKVTLNLKENKGQNGIISIPVLAVTAGIHDKSGLVIIKMVNSFNTSKKCRIVLNYRQKIKYKGETIVMTSGNIMDSNSFTEPEKVVPMTRELSGLQNTFDYDCPANSIVIIHLRYKKGINGFVDCC